MENSVTVSMKCSLLNCILRTAIFISVGDILKLYTSDEVWPLIFENYIASEHWEVHSKVL